MPDTHPLTKKDFEILKQTNISEKEKRGTGLVKTFEQLRDNFLETFKCAETIRKARMRAGLKMPS